MTSDMYSRQSFLGVDAQDTIGAATIGIVGLGGGGSHIVQQLAHLGVRRFCIYDPDTVELSNLNRLVGGTTLDALARRSKAAVARRVVDGLHTDAAVSALEVRWQVEPGPLRACDLIFGCLDTLSDRRELEVCARRFLIPYLDIGLGVTVVGDEPPRMTGQVVLSMPGSPCFRCLGFLSERGLAEEAAHYGDAGPRPQVVWANGVLASIAVGVGIELLTGWTRHAGRTVYLSYDGNNGTVTQHARLPYVGALECSHFPSSEVGDPTFVSL